MSPRMSADERRDQVIRAAVTEFAIRGLEGTSTSDIAKRVGVSQPYLFRLFPTKRDLFIAATKYGADQVRAVFTHAAEGKYGTEALAAMGEAYQDLLMADDEVLNIQLQQFAACHDPEVQRAVRHNMQDIWHHVENLTGTTVEVRVDFFAKGMLCNMIAAMGRASGDDPMWQPILDVLRDDVKQGSADADADADLAATANEPAGTATAAGNENDESADSFSGSNAAPASDDAGPVASTRADRFRESGYAAYVEQAFGGYRPVVAVADERAPEDRTPGTSIGGFRPVVSVAVEQGVGESASQKSKPDRGSS